MLSKLFAVTPGVSSVSVSKQPAYSDSDSHSDLLICVPRLQLLLTHVLTVLA